MTTIRSPSPTPTCPSNAALVELVEGRLPAAARERLDEHVAACSACARFVGALSTKGEPEAVHSSGTLDLWTAQAIVGGPVERAPSAILDRGTLVDRYLVLSLIGRGGMGEVYAAYDPDLDRRVALKLLHVRRGTESARARLLKEARALAKLSHPNVVQVYDVGEHEGDVFVAMELVTGQPLGVFCKGPPRPPFGEVLSAYRDAARGLAAAHAQGIVHRDVKPANVLRGEDGRVRVADFGLAAGRSAPGDGAAQGAVARAPEDLSETVPARAGSEGGGDGDAQLTATGALVGTPLYMAPEQFDGSEVGPAADQHSLCTALYEGLYGALPFPVLDAGPDLMRQILARKKEGPPEAQPAGSAVPASIHRAIVRGLAPRPEDRFPSMDALADALREEAPPRGRPILRAAAIGAILLVAVAGLAARAVGPADDPCAHPERQLAGVWDGGVKGRVREALAGTGLSYAEDTAGRVAQIIDHYTASWASMRREVCEAGRSGRQRREIVALRDACLDRRLAQVQALTGTLAEKANGSVLDKAVHAASGLPPIDACADVEALSASVRPPEDPALRALVAALTPRVDRIEALHAAGKFQEGLRDGEALLPEVRAFDYAPLRARVEFWVAELRKGAGDNEGAKELLRAAAASAALGRDEALSTSAWAELLFVVGEKQRRFDEAAVIRALGPTAVGRTSDAVAQARWFNAEGNTLWRMGKLAEGRAALERALALRVKALGPDHPDVASVLGNLGSCAHVAGAYAEARSFQERSVALYEKLLGPEHPETARTLSNLGVTLDLMGEYAEAVAVAERTLAVRERALGPDHRDVASSLNNLGSALISTGDYPRAAAVCARALAIREKTLGPDHPFVGSALSNLGHAKARLGQLDEARPLLERALAIHEKAEGKTHISVSKPLLYLGDLALARGKPEEAALLLERALALHDAETEGEVELTLAEALWRIGKDRPRARALAEQARARYASIGHRPGQEHAARWLADHPG